MEKVDPSVLNVPQGGHSHTVRQSMVVQGDRPVPGGGRPRPKPRTTKTLAKVRALYDYDAQENDEISIKAGESFDLVREGSKVLYTLNVRNVTTDDTTGWWTGKINGQEGFFPGNYVEKI